MSILDACKEGNKELVELLLKDGEDVEAMGGYDETILMIACERGYKEIVELLLTYGADVNGWNYDGRSVLMEASYRGHKNIVELLLNNGADVNAMDDWGRTALDEATYSANFRGHKDKGVVELLKQHITIKQVNKMLEMEKGLSVYNYNLALEECKKGCYHIAYEYIIRAITNLRKEGIEDTDIINIDYFQLKGDILCYLNREDEAELYFRKCKKLSNMSEKELTNKSEYVCDVLL